MSPNNNNNNNIKNSASPPEKLEHLKTKFPESTESERLRFLTHKNFNVKQASNKLEEYMKFRKEYDLDEKKTSGNLSNEDNGKTDWEEVSEIAMQWGRKHQPRRHRNKKKERENKRKEKEREREMRKKNKNKNKNQDNDQNNDKDNNNDDDKNQDKEKDNNSSQGDENSSTSDPPLQDESEYDNEDDGDDDTPIPQILFISRDPASGQPFKALDGSIVLNVLAGRVKRVMATAESYAITLALFIDRLFDRDSLETATLLLDVRPGEGWTNPNPVTMVNFIKHTSKYLNSLYPLRLNLCLIYPLPKVIPVVWDTVRPVLDKDIVKLVTLIGSPEKKNLVPPYEKLETYVKREILDILEENRISLYKK